MRLSASLPMARAHRRHRLRRFRRETAELGAPGCARALGDRVPITFEVDPELVAGAELHFPTAILRFSWQSALAVHARGDRRPWRRSLTICANGSTRAGSASARWRSSRRLEHVGRVMQVGDGVAIVEGLPETRLDELLIFEGGVRGLAVDLGERDDRLRPAGRDRRHRSRQHRARHGRGGARPGRRRAARPRRRCAWAFRSTAASRLIPGSSCPSSSRRPRSSTARW